jgi:hypothetical protein
MKNEMTTTTDTPRTMTNEQIRIAIAEAHGTMKWSYALPTKCIAVGVPDYCNDLNAMHEAEKTLSSAQLQREYADILDDGNGGHFATALQRAEAFLKIIRKSKK